jgi:hypothetical protein
MKQRFTTSDPMVSFFYTLLRDEVLPGTMEKYIVDMKGDTVSEWELSNVHLAKYAKSLVSQIENMEGE